VAAELEPWIPTRTSLPDIWMSPEERSTIAGGNPAVAITTVMPPDSEGR
jgi:hypothetical protein